MKSIKVKIICTACRKDCGEAMFAISDHLQLCFDCVDTAKQKADEWRKNAEVREITALSVIIERTFTDYSRDKAMNLAGDIYSAGYRKLTGDDNNDQIQTSDD